MADTPPPPLGDIEDQPFDLNSIGYFESTEENLASTDDMLMMMQQEVNDSQDVCLEITSLPIHEQQGQGLLRHLLDSSQETNTSSMIGQNFEQEDNGTTSISNVPSTQFLLSHQDLLDSSQEPKTSTIMEGGQHAEPEHNDTTSIPSELFGPYTLSHQALLNSFPNPNTFLMMDIGQLVEQEHNGTPSIPHVPSQQNVSSHQTLSNSFEEPNTIAMMENGQHVEQEHNGYTYPTMTNSFQSPIYLQEHQLPIPLTQEEQSLSHELRFPNNNYSITTSGDLVWMQNQQEHPFSCLHSSISRQPLTLALVNGQDNLHHGGSSSSSAQQNGWIFNELPEENERSTAVDLPNLRSPLIYNPRYEDHGLFIDPRMRTLALANGQDNLHHGGSSSSSAQQNVWIFNELPEENERPTAVDLPDLRSPLIYNPRYEDHGLFIDPRMRTLALANGQDNLHHGGSSSSSAQQNVWIFNELPEENERPTAVDLPDLRSPLIYNPRYEDHSLFVDPRMRTLVVVNGQDNLHHGGSSSSSAQQNVWIFNELPEENERPAAVDLPDLRSPSIYNPRYEDHGLFIDPRMRTLALANGQDNLHHGGSSSSSAQQNVWIFNELPEENERPAAVDRPNLRSPLIYNSRYEGHGLFIDPHMRSFSGELEKKNG